MEASVTLNLDASPFRQELSNTEQVVTRGASNMQNKFASIFKRSPNMRAERAISGSLQAFASGDIAGGIESITNRMTGLGLVAGVAIGAGVAIFMKFRDQIVATREAHAALEMEMTKHPLSVVSKLSTEGLSQALETRQKLLETAAEKSKHTFGSELGEAFTSTLAFGGRNEGKERVDQQKLENQASVENKEIMMKRAELAEKLAAIERMRETSGEHIANLAKINLKLEEEQAALKGKGLSAAAFRKEDAALVDTAQRAIGHEDKRAASKERSLAIEEKIANLVKKGLKPEDEKKVRAGLELGSINEALKGETDVDARRSLMLQKTQKENELRGMAGPDQSNPFTQGSLSARDWERNKDSAGFNSNFASFGLTQQQQDTKGPAAPNAEVVTEVSKTNELLRQIFLSAK